MNIVDIEKENHNSVGWDDFCGNCTHSAQFHNRYRGAMEACRTAGCTCEAFVDERKVLCKGCGSKVLTVVSWKNTKTILHTEGCKAQKVCQQKNNDGRICGRPIVETIPVDEHRPEAGMVHMCGLHLRMERNEREQIDYRQQSVYLDAWQTQTYKQQAAELTERLGVLVVPEASYRGTTKRVFIDSDHLMALCNLYDIKDRVLEQPAAEEEEVLEDAQG